MKRKEDHFIHSKQTVHTAKEGTVGLPSLQNLTMFLESIVRTTCRGSGRSPESTERQRVREENCGAEIAVTHRHPNAMHGSEKCGCSNIQAAYKHVPTSRKEKPSDSSVAVCLRLVPIGLVRHLFMLVRQGPKQGHQRGSSHPIPWHLKKQAKPCSVSPAPRLGAELHSDALPLCRRCSSSIGQRSGVMSMRSRSASPSSDSAHRPWRRIGTSAVL